MLVRRAGSVMMQNWRSWLPAVWTIAIALPEQRDAAGHALYNATNRQPALELLLGAASWTAIGGAVAAAIAAVGKVPYCRCRAAGSHVPVRLP